MPTDNDADRLPRPLERAALIEVLLLPLGLMHARAGAEVLIAGVVFWFLGTSWRQRDWAWARTPWFVIAAAWWGWQVICSLPIPALSLGEGGANSLIQAVVIGRFPIFAAALEHAILRPAAARRTLWWVIAASAAYIAAHAAFQFVTGYNLYGYPRGPARELTGPFQRPRAGGPFVRILLPSVLPWVAARMNRPGLAATFKAWSLPIAGIVVAVLMIQRMPIVLLGFGLAISGLLMPRLRRGVIVTGIAVAALLIASPIVAPDAHERLVTHFSDQLAHFSTTQYGELYARAVAIGERNPVTGLGTDGFKTGCANPAYFRPGFDGTEKDGGGAAICWHHPHQYYLEAWVAGGIPGLILFTAMGIAWMLALGRGLWRDPDPVRVGLFAAMAMQVWPIASSTGFTTMPLAGWSFLLLGWGLAEARWRSRDL